MNWQIISRKQCWLCLLTLLPTCLLADENHPTGAAVIRSSYAGSDIVITTTSRLAGAIDSVTWKGQEFINSADHGRQLQSASNFDAGLPFAGETFNPTEAGSRFDGAGPKSTSRLLHLLANEHQLQTTVQMAFWLRPGETSGGHPARNSTRLSNHLLTKRVVIGYGQFPNVIQYHVTFSVPVGEDHKYAQFEAVTGYMPPDFSRFLTLNTTTGKTADLSDGPGEQKWPVILTTPSGTHAMGIYSPDQPSPGYLNAGYGRWRFAAQKVVKWNCVFRLQDQQHGIAAGDYSYRTFVTIGDLDNVVQTMLALHRQFSAP